MRAWVIVFTAGVWVASLVPELPRWPLWCLLLPAVPALRYLPLCSAWLLGLFWCLQELQGSASALLPGELEG